MSTGENLLLSVLNSLHLRILDRASKNKPCIMFLDEIELALHPSSLKRLVNFLGVVANEYNYAIYFSTHSIELISSIKPDNIYYVKRYIDNSIQIINPCYPAYATKFLYDHAGYDRIILVEDDLAKDIVWRIIQDKKLINNQLIHILPCGGYTNVIQLADDVVRNNLLSKNASIMVILDKDVQVGDVISTITVLIQGQPSIRWIFSHTTDRGQVNLDTDELKEVLGDIPLDTFEVIVWIGDYLKEQYNNIGY